MHTLLLLAVATRSHSALGGDAGERALFAVTCIELVPTRGARAAVARARGWLPGRAPIVRANMLYSCLNRLRVFAVIEHGLSTAGLSLLHGGPSWCGPLGA